MSLTPYPHPFYNRKDEMAALERAWGRPGSGGQMAMLYGRRRLGKTYLLQRFFGGEARAASRPHCYFLAEQSTAHEQRLALASQLLQALPDASVSAPAELAVSWNAILRHVSTAVGKLRPIRTGRFGLILDEFPYLVERTPELPSLLQAWWDREASHIPVFVILCGSQLSAMAALGSHTAPLFGRFNAGTWLLPPLRYDEVASFYEGSRYSVAQRLTMYGILGGTPRYHALVDAQQPMEEEIVDLMLRPQSPLESEVRYLMGSQQIRDPAPYNAVLSAIARGETHFSRLSQQSGTEPGSLPYYIRNLVELGWVRKEVPFGAAAEKRALYRIADPFLAFWYRFVSRLASEFQFSEPRRVFDTRIAPRLADYMGLTVFEDICHQWLTRNASTGLGLSLRGAGRYWSRDGSLEIDVMAGVDDGTFLFGECKWCSQGRVGLQHYADLQAKVARLPRAEYQVEPTLVIFSAGGFAPQLLALSRDPSLRLHLVGPDQLLPKVKRGRAARRF